MNFYLYTNIGAGILIMIIFVSALALENFTFKKISLKHLTVISLFAACSAILTGLTYKIPPIFGNIHIALGDWIIFLLGLIFGPLCGVISAICTDTLMAIVLPSNYGYHAGYMFGKCVLAFFGSLVFLTRGEKRILLKVIVLYTVAYILQSLFLNQIWMMSWKGMAAWLDFISKLIKLPISLPIYISITYLSYLPIRKLLENWNNEFVWCFKSEYLNKNLDY
ncbi:folate family ECF transporter S component [Spiroplasma floricola]|uniref:Folate family ECF transporter S component n=1 Tax=Spiroplasma floricola 23-6 TaxID=1336749 RepID=A0A2K8SD35_9MOLU|nr:folate family ECF transporter S component [Spiroplasma floricola]AUB31128.1 folate family ECF transporter S component [Spiroplasma floricola 23-6]